MKKVLVLFLISVIACSFIDDLKEVGVFDERDDEVLRGLPDFFSRLWDKVKQFFKDLPGNFKKVCEWLKNNGYWDTLIDIIQKYGTQYGTTFCAKYFDESLCHDVVSWLFSLLDSL